MKRNFARYIALALSSLLLLVPFIYNSCQGVMTAKSSGSNSSASSSCKVMLENGVVTKLKITHGTPAAFAAQKVRLRSLEGNQKAGEVTLSRGTELAVILNNACVENSTNHSAIVDGILHDSQPSPELISQAYTWNLDREYTDSELEVMSDQDPCVVGISWNKEYTMQALNDPGYSFQTHLPAIRAEQAYNEFFNVNYGMDLTGTAVKVAVIDTGIDWTHPDLAANIWIHQNGWGVDATTLKTNLVNYNPVDVSTIGHGTHVSGIIAAVSNNGVGITGAMPYRAKIMAIKVFKVQNGQTTTNSTYVYNGLQFAYLNGASVANMSLAATSTGANTDVMVEAGIDEALANGMLVVTVIGNADGNSTAKNVDGVNFSSIPAQFSIRPGVIGVGSFDSSSGNKSSFSHYSTTYAEIGAPGAEQGTTGIYSTLPVALNSYGRLAGTSQAGPQVSAAAALTIGLIKEATGVPPTPAEVERLILESAVKSNSLTTYFKNGNRLDLLNLVQKIHLDYPKTKDPNASPNTPTTCI